MELTTEMLSEIRKKVESFSTSTDAFTANNEHVLSGTVPVELRVQSLSAEIQKLKFELVALRSKELFLEKIASCGNDGSTDEYLSLFPSMDELNDIEIQLAEEKTSLSKIKSKRGDVEATLPEVAALYATAHEQLSKAKADIAEMVNAIQSAAQMAVAKRLLATDDFDGIEKLLASPVLYRGTIEILTNRFTLGLETREDIEKARMDERHVIHAVAAEDAEIAELEAELANLQRDVEENMQSNADSQALQQEGKLADAELSIAQALTGIEIEKVRENEVAVSVRPHVFGGSQFCEPDLKHSIKIGVKNGIVTKIMRTSSDGNCCVEKDLSGSGLSVGVPFAVSTEVTSILAGGQN